MSKFQYVKRDSKNMRKRSEQWGNDRDSFLSDHVPIWKPSDGANTIRILPPSWEGAEHYGFDIYVHYQIGPDNSAYLDLTKMKHEPDPITEEVARLRQAGDIDAAKELDSKKRILIYLIDRDKPKEGVMMWAMPWTVDRDIANQCYDQRTNEALLVDSPEEGYDVIITKSGGKGKYTEYSVKIDRKSSPLRMTPEIETLLDEYPLPSCVNFFSYEHIKKAFGGGKSASKASDASEFDLDTISYADLQAMSSKRLDRLLQYCMEEGIEVEEFTDDEELLENLAAALNIAKPKARKAEPPARRMTTPPPRTVAPVDEEEDEPAPPKKAASKREELEEEDIPFDSAEVEEEEDVPPAPKRAAKSAEGHESPSPRAAADLKARLANLRNRNK